MPILISGESGVGKDHVARALHRFSARRHGPWVTLDCAVGGADFEGLLFGREATPQAAAQRGLVELAEGGTLLLCEIGDLAMDLQPKLLRLLETQRFRRVGAVRDQHAHVRFIALTHHDLAAAAAHGRFRPDLYYRLEVGRLDIPPLRERPQDIAALASHFMGSVAQRLRRRPLLIDDAVQARLAAYAWPGNARELRNVVERMLILSRDDGCAADVLHAALPAGSSALRAEPPAAPGWRLVDVELHHIRRAMQHCQGNKTKAAELLGISRLTLRQRLKDGEPD